MCALISPSISLFSHVHKRHHIMIWYNIRCYFNMCSKAVITELNLPHGTKNWKVEIRKTKKKKSDMLRSIGKCTCDSSSLWPTHGTLMLPQFSLVDACWLSIRKLEASVQLSMDSLCGGWLPSVLTRLEPRNWLLFYPHQLGIGTPGGCEAAVHSSRRYLEALPEDHVLVKLDFSSAFNSIHRREMLLAVHSRTP